jgi:hypothetical protein
MSLHAIYDDHSITDDGHFVVRIVDTERAQRTWSITFEDVRVDGDGEPTDELVPVTSTLLLSSAGRWFTFGRGEMECASPAEWLANHGHRLSQDDVRAIAEAASLLIE